MVLGCQFVGGQVGWQVDCRCSGSIFLLLFGWLGPAVEPVIMKILVCVWY